jgi:hypothetical protein
MFIPDPKFFHTGSQICIKEFKYLIPTKTVLSSRKYDPVVHPGSGLFIPDPDPGCAILRQDILGSGAGMSYVDCMKRNACQVVKVEHFLGALPDLNMETKRVVGQRSV